MTKKSSERKEDQEQLTKLIIFLRTVHNTWSHIYNSCWVTFQKLPIQTKNKYGKNSNFKQTVQ